MKFYCGPTEAERERALKDKAKQEEGKWFPYFAWLPVRVITGECRWLETVERKRDWLHIWYGREIHWGVTEYRAIAKARGEA